jgi:pyruvate,orthophosphate dikinase
MSVVSAPDRLNVSCSPFRVPIARLAAAQARLKEQGVGGSVSK